MSLQFHQAVENMDVWSASSADISFVITFASPTGPGFHGRRGFLASWRPFYSSKGAVEVTGSPFETFAEAERACNTKLEEWPGQHVSGVGRNREAEALAKSPRINCMQQPDGNRDSEQAAEHQDHALPPLNAPAQCPQIGSLHADAACHHQRDGFKRLKHMQQDAAGHRRKSKTGKT